MPKTNAQYLKSIDFDITAITDDDYSYWQSAAKIPDELLKKTHICHTRKPRKLPTFNNQFDSYWDNECIPVIWVLPPDTSECEEEGPGPLYGLRDTAKVLSKFYPYVIGGVPENTLLYIDGVLCVDEAKCIAVNHIETHLNRVQNHASKNKFIKDNTPSSNSYI